MCDPWLLTGFASDDRSYEVFPAHSRTYTFTSEVGKKKARLSLKKTHTQLGWGEKYIYTHFLPIFPFSHWPVQVVRSPQSIIFTAVTDGRPAGCNYFYRYWGHLEVVSPHWKTEALGSHKGQVFITCSLAWIHRRILKSNWMHRHKEKSAFFFRQGKKCGN